MSKELEDLEYIENKLKDLEYIAKQNDNEYLLSKYIPSEKFNTIKQALLELKSIKEANPSEALKELELVENWIRDRELEISNVIEPSLNIVKNTLLKAQEPKQYLKWEDLEFKEEEQKMKVLLNGNKYTLDYYSDGYDDYIDFLTDNEQDRIAIYEGGYPNDKQFFNDLHLEWAKECSNCKKQHTNDCPNSSECYSKKDKPYWERVEE